ncbi:MAG: DUF504 domain-containing protein [Candidatus Thermoplasmatota archaeon]|nr:DUF504 domain-containing protein [Candidatus Thermoplasmatota archaeon]
MIGHPRDILLREKWSGDGLSDISVEFKDRGSPGDTGSIKGPSISHIGRSFMELDHGGMVPFHRVIRISHQGKTIWKRDIKGGP